MNKSMIGGASIALLAAAAFIVYSAGRQESPRPATTASMEQGTLATGVKPAEAKQDFTPISAPTEAALSIPAEKTTRAVFHQNPFEGTREDRLKSIEKSIEQKYAKTIRALKLSSADEIKLRELLTHRAEAAYVAHDAVSSTEHKPGDLGGAISSLQAEVDEDIQRSFDVDTAKKVQLMIMASDYLNRVNQSISRALTEAGEPLSPEQVLPLAVVLMQTYGSLNNPVSKPTVASVDPATFLTPMDELALARTAALLSPRQITALKQLIGAQNKAALSLPDNS